MFDSIFAKLTSAARNAARAIGAIANRVPLCAFPVALILLFLV
jgi:hypothetical protein